MVIKSFEYKQKVFVNLQIRIGIRLSPSEMNMWNSILQVLLTHTHSTKECMIRSFIPIISV